MEHLSQPGTFHVGLHKTGTTYLQQSVFPYAVDANITRGWTTLREFYNTEPRQHWLHSDEGISGKPWGGKISYGDAFRHNLSICQNMLGINKYIITVRPLESWTKSLWKQYIHEGGVIDPKYFFNGSNSIMNLECCLMAPKIKWLKNRADVLVISQEELKQSELTVIEKISAFTGICFDTSRFQSRSVKKNLNIGITSQRQTQFLLIANEINDKLKSIHPRLNLNNRHLRKLGLTPRYIAQNRLKGSNQTPFKIDFEFSRKQLDAVRQDWEEVQLYL